MNQETGAWLAVALLSVSALGVSATTLESTVSTDANDVIDLDYDQVPIGQDTASTVMDEIEGDEQEGEPASSTRADPGEQRDSTSHRPAEGQPQQQQQTQEQSQAESAETGLAPMSLFDRLLALLTALLPYLLVLAALLGAAGLAVKYRERLLAAFGDDPATEDARDGVAAADETDPLDGSPAHAVERAWLGMVRHLDLDRPKTMTTSECASAAIEAGLDRDAVKRLTETYEEVRYGGRPVTDQREQTAERSRDRLDVEGGA